jgi:UDP-glucuronate decarboxylase
VYRWTGTPAVLILLAQDLVDGLIKLMNGNYTQPVNIGNPDEYTVKKFAEMVKELVNSKSKIVHLPPTKDDPHQRKPDISTAKREIGWQPRWSVQDGLAETIEYFRKELEETGAHQQICVSYDSHI